LQLLRNEVLTQCQSLSEYLFPQRNIRCKRTTLSVTHNV